MIEGMDKQRFFSQAVADAIDKAGGVSSVAKSMDVTYQSVREWHIGMRRLPGPRALQLARMADVPAETLRPDLAGYWQSIREAA